MPKSNTFMPGDIFVVEDQGPSGGELPSLSLAAYVTRVFLGLPVDKPPDTASALHWLQSKSWNENPQFVHAGLILNEDYVIEMMGQGIKIGKISDELGGKKITLFRCRDKEVTELALDLAINMEKTLIEDEFPQLGKEEAENYPGRIQYDFLMGLVALGSKVPKEKQITKIHKELSDIAESMHIPKKMFCSQMVVHVYSMANILLEKPQSMFLPLNALPGMLHGYLMTNPYFEHQEVMVKEVAGPDVEKSGIYKAKFKRAINAESTAKDHDPKRGNSPS